jgi:hypothetical protein
MTRASPFSAAGSVNMTTSVAQPCCLRSRAATKPSPPLLPGPQSTQTRAPGDSIDSAAWATARPAFSINSSDGTPAASAKASARRISSTLRSSFMGNATSRALRAADVDDGRTGVVKLWRQVRRLENARPG